MQIGVILPLIALLIPLCRATENYKGWPRSLRFTCESVSVIETPSVISLVNDTKCGVNCAEATLTIIYDGKK